MAKAPCSRGRTAATASSGDAPRSTSRATRCATTSVSVSLSNCAPVGDQLVAQRLEILDDAVVDQRDRPDDVRMGVADGRRAMRRPAGVGDADDRRAADRAASSRARLSSLPSARRRSSSPSLNGADAG